MSPPAKSKKSSSSWQQCEDCGIYIPAKELHEHGGDCPPSELSPNSFVKDEVLFGGLDATHAADVGGAVDKDSRVFLSQATIQLCKFAIGEWCVVKGGQGAGMAKVVWPTTEKSLTSVLLTARALELSGLKINDKVQVSKLPCNTPEAYTVHLIGLNCNKSLKLTSELINRITRTYNKKIITLGNKICLMYFGKILKFEIKLIEGASEFNLESSFECLKINSNDQFYRITEKTKLKIFGNFDEYEKEAAANVNLLSQIGGLETEIVEIQEAIKACLDTNHKSYGLKNSRSILLCGHSGTGKTLVATAIVREIKCHTITICAPDLYSKYSGNVEDTIKSLFDEAKQQAPSIIILDEVDILCPSRSQRMTDSEKRVVSTLLTMLDNLGQSKVFVLATTNKVEAVDPVFRRYGRFDREIEISVPNSKNRANILSKMLKDVEHCLSSDDLNEIAINTHGFVGADLASLCSMAGLNATKRSIDKIELVDFKLALKDVRPSAMREVEVEVANVRWSDIGGQENVKLMLKQAVEWPLTHPQSFIRLGVTPPRGVLMFGPPGCSKTMIAKALATESGLNFLSIKGSELFSKWVGESEKAVRDVFRKARQVSPSIIFFDEIDALGGERSSASSTSVQERVLAQLLTELDGVSPLGDVTILAATNRPDRIDKALLRPGRLDRIVYVPLPDESTRKEIFKIKFATMPIQDVDIEVLVQSTHNYSGAEIKAVCHEAAMAALEESLSAQYVKIHHFEKALNLIKPRTTQDTIDFYNNYVKK